MALSKVFFNCGCGFKTDNPVLALAHVDETGHLMEAVGTIVPAKNSKQRSGKNEGRQHKDH